MTEPLYEIAVIPGDGIGPEVVAAAVAVLPDAPARHNGDDSHSDA